jgi:hypothetical protein
LGKEGASKYTFFSCVCQFEAQAISSKHGTGVTVMFVHLENKSWHAIEQLLTSDKVLYACVEMIENPTLMPLWAFSTYRYILVRELDVLESSWWKF